jgi:hypothetical protein
MLHLSSNEHAQPYAQELADLLDRVENFRSVDDFAQAVENIIPSTSTAFSQAFDELLMNIGKKKSHL